jgi:hypothetical protein
MVLVLLKEYPGGHGQTRKVVEVEVIRHRVKERSN